MKYSLLHNIIWFIEQFKKFAIIQIFVILTLLLLPFLSLKTNIKVTTEHQSLPKINSPNAFCVYWQLGNCFFFYAIKIIGFSHEVEKETIIDIL